MPRADLCALPPRRRRWGPCLSAAGAGQRDRADRGGGGGARGSRQLPRRARAAAAAVAAGEPVAGGAADGARSHALPRWSRVDHARHLLLSGAVGRRPGLRRAVRRLFHNRMGSDLHARYRALRRDGYAMGRVSDTIRQPHTSHPPLLLLPLLQAPTPSGCTRSSCRGATKSSSTRPRRRTSSSSVPSRWATPRRPRCSRRRSGARRRRGCGGM